jgi:hypothetical protein
MVLPVWDCLSQSSDAEVRVLLCQLKESHSRILTPATGQSRRFWRGYSIPAGPSSASAFRNDEGGCYRTTTSAPTETRL